MFKMRYKTFQDQRYQCVPEGSMGVSRELRDVSKGLKRTSEVQRSNRRKYY